MNQAQRYTTYLKMLNGWHPIMWPLWAIGGFIGCLIAWWTTHNYMWTQMFFVFWGVWALLGVILPPMCMAIPRYISALTAANLHKSFYRGLHWWFFNRLTAHALRSQVFYRNADAMGNPVVYSAQIGGWTVEPNVGAQAVVTLPNVQGMAGMRDNAFRIVEQMAVTHLWRCRVTGVTDESGMLLTVTIRWNDPEVNSGTPADKFRGESWPSTALLMGITQSAFDPNLPRTEVWPVNGDIDYADGVHVRIIPNPGVDPTRYSGLQGAFRSVSNYRYSHEESDGMSVVYTLGHKRHDPFPKVIEWVRPQDVDLMNVPIGVDADGHPVTMATYGEHTRLVATSGSGKGSVLWSVIGSLAGRNDTRMIGVDFKGGKELRMGAQAFASEIVTERDDFVMTIQSLYEDMKERQKINAERGVRDFVPSAEQPLTVLVIDEAMEVQKTLNSLGKEDAQLLENAMDGILTQGRSEGVIIFAAMQYPYKTAFKWADRFVNTVTLRLSDESAQVSALGPGSIDKVGPLWEYDTSVRGTDRGRGAIQMYGEWIQFKAYYPNDTMVQNLPQSVTSWESRY